MVARSRGISQSPENYTQIELSLRKIGPDAHRLLKMATCLAIRSSLQKESTVIVMHPIVVWVYLQSCLKLPAGLVRQSPFLCYHRFVITGPRITGLLGDGVAP